MAAETSKIDSKNIPELSSEPPRTSLVETAVKFLQNPKVQQSSLEERKQFLLKKGLTNEEIELSIARAGVNAVPSPSANTAVVVRPQQEIISTWGHIRNYSAIAIIIGGLVYGVHSIYQWYMEVPLFKHKDDKDARIEELENYVKVVSNQMNQNLQDIHSVVNEMKEKLDEQTHKIDDVSLNLSAHKAMSTGRGVSDSIGELRSEITSVKGLLLSRNQFPSQQPPVPVIPSWQMRPKLTDPIKTQNDISDIKMNGVSEPAVTDDQETEPHTVEDDTANMANRTKNEIIQENVATE